MRLFLCLILLASSLFGLGQKKQVCFSFDDLPLVSYGERDTCFQKGLMSKLIYSLKKNKVPAIGFVNESKLYEKDRINRFQVELLRSWISNGLDLGNHTFGHPDYNSTSFEDFTSDILKGEINTKKIVASSGKRVKYFRHPFLHVGNTKAKADSLKNFLLNQGYTEAPVSIDNEDYLFALAYHRANMGKDTTLKKKIGKDYICYMEKKLNYYEKQANILFGRNIKHILLLHASYLNSDYADALIALFMKNNYDFISLEKALEDQAYKTEITIYGNWGISWLDRWALSKGKKGDFFRDDPESPEYIKKLAE